MRLVACAVAGLLTLGTGAASAQPVWGPDYRGAWRPAPGWVGPMTPERVVFIVESMGLDPIGPPIQSGRAFVQRATDAYGRIMRVTIDPERRPSVVAEAPGGPAYGRPYAAYGEPTWRRPYPGYSAMSPDEDEYEAAPPRDIPRPYQYPSNVQPQPLPPHPAARAPAERSATITPAAPTKTPVPRKRPDNLETAKKTEPGTVAPVPAAPPSPAPQSAPAASPAPSAMPPINPLE